MQTKQQGFSLIELLIALAIVGILAGVAVPSYVEFNKRGERTDALRVMQQILDAQERYFFNNETYTASLTDAADADGNAGLNINASLINLDEFTITARSCEQGGNAVALTVCVELRATASQEQSTDGGLVRNTAGRLAVCPGNDFSNCSSI